MPVKTFRLRIPKATTAITIQIDSEVLAWFKSKGKGCQYRINEVLRSYVEAQEA